MHKNALMKLKNIRKGENVKIAEERRSVSSVVRGSNSLTLEFSNFGYV